MKKNHVYCILFICPTNYKKHKSREKTNNCILRWTQSLTQNLFPVVKNAVMPSNRYIVFIVFRMSWYFNPRTATPLVAWVSLWRHVFSPVFECGRVNTFYSMNENGKWMRRCCCGNSSLAAVPAAL